MDNKRNKLKNIMRNRLRQYNPDK